MLKYINNKASILIINYATIEVKKISNIIINKAVSKHITKNFKTNEMFEITKDSTGEIKSIDFNTPLVNRFLTEATNSVQNNLKNLEKGRIDNIEFKDELLESYNIENLKKGIVYEVSMGVVMGNTFLANIGPKIPVKISIIGSASSYISTKIKNYGINNAMINVYVNIEINEKVILPFYNQLIKVKTKIPVAMKIVTGSVPDYYVNGINESTPPVALPN